MPSCIFCLTESNDLTDEHVFPAALGGNLVVKDAACRACNNRFSGEFEQEVVGRFAHLRHIFRIPDRYGNVPHVDATVEVDGKSLDGRLLGNGTLKLKPIFTEHVGSDGVKEMVAHHVSEEQVEQLRKDGWEKGETTPGFAVEGSFSGQLDFID